ncbi:MAG: hypothetical protein BLM47_03950 [Candidatus Reconcilbacillus cellulovorans]|uniref:Uncharacterized protein n=1 Tax=Candidatus Reconcilbacillus cellulovorans TaxID=1906605 RepID=A0A2A6E277_9BACL|nr:MAG: hypothetical protein BLM47_03950 [Candidatus Reconcilbacillus cellulovorans]
MKKDILLCRARKLDFSAKFCYYEPHESLNGSTVRRRSRLRVPSRNRTTDPRRTVLFVRRRPPLSVVDRPL